MRRQCDLRRMLPADLRNHCRRRMLPAGLRVAVLLAAATVTFGCATPFPAEEFPRRSLPQGWMPQWRELAPGIDYARWQGEGFPPFHLVQLDLERAALELPPPFPEGARLRELLKRPGVAGVINASPFRFTGDAGNRRMEPAVLWIAGGRRYSSGEKQWAVLWYDREAERLRITGEAPGTDEARWAAGGFLPIIRDGRNVGIHGQRHARTAAGLRKGGREICFLVIEGERLGNAGVTSWEAAQVLLRLGIREALNLDGGRSSALLLQPAAEAAVVEFTAGRWQLPCLILLKRGDS